MELLIYLVAAIAIASVIAFAGFDPSFFIPTAATFIIMLLVQTFVVSTVRPLIQSTDRPIQFSLRHLFYVSFGAAILAASFGAIAPISIAILIGLVFGGLTVGASLIASHSLHLGIPIVAIAFVSSYFLPAVKTLPNGVLGMLPLALLTAAILVASFIVLDTKSVFPQGDAGIG